MLIYRITLAPLLSCLLAAQAPEAGAAAAPAAKPTALLPIAIDRPAPDLGLAEWLGKAKSPGPIGKVVRVGGGDLPGGIPELNDELEAKIKESLKGIGQAINAGQKQPGDLALYHKKVVLVHVIDWGQPSASSDLIDLVRDVVHANEDRGLQAIGIMADDEESQTQARQAGLDWPIGLTSLRNSPSLYVTPAKQSRVFVIGRSGQLVWRGNPSSNRGAFLKALAAALNQLGAERIEGNLGESFGEALSLYYAESLSKALAQAERLKTAAKADEQMRVDAERLIIAAKESELSWLRAMRSAAKRRRDFDQYVRNIDGLVKAFAKTSGKEAKAHEKATSRKSNNAQRLKDERKLQELQALRPALFPARKSKAHDRFAKSIDKFLSSKRLTDEAERRALDLTDRYRSTAK